MGAKIIKSLKSLHYTAKGHEYMLEQSERPEGPFMVAILQCKLKKILKNSKCLYSLNMHQFKAYQIFVDRDRVGAIRARIFSQCILKQMSK